MPWKSGQSGNPTGAKREPKRFMAAIERAIAQDDGERIRKCAETLLDMAADGVPWAVQMLADRLDGRTNQTVEIGVSATFESTVSDFTAFLAHSAGFQEDGRIEGMGEGRSVVSAEIPAKTH